MQTFRAIGADHKRAFKLLQEASRFDGCSSMIDDILLDEHSNFEGKYFLEARGPDGRLCGIAIYRFEADALFVELLCSDCKGTGTLMIAKLSELARASEKPIVKLFSAPGATGFYLKMGFALSPGESIKDWGQLMQKAAGRTYRRRRQRKHGSASVRRHKTRRVPEGQVSA